MGIEPDGKRGWAWADSVPRPRSLPRWLSYGVQHRFQEARALAVLGGRIEQVRDDARQPDFVFAQVLEHVEPGCLTALTLPVGRYCRLKLRREFRQETHALPMPGLPGVIHLAQQFGDPASHLHALWHHLTKPSAVAVRSPSKRLPPLWWSVQIAHFRIRIVRAVGIWTRTSKVACRCAMARIEPPASADPHPGLRYPTGVADADP